MAAWAAADSMVAWAAPVDSMGASMAGLPVAGFMAASTAAGFAAASTTGSMAAGAAAGVGLWLPLVLWRLLPFLRSLCVSVPGLRAAAAGLFAAGRLLRATSGAPALPSRDAPAPALHLLHGDIVLN